MFNVVEPPWALVYELSTPCYLCNNVVRSGSWRFDALELPRTGAKATYPPKFKDVFREDSVESNHHAEELYTPAAMWFGQVHGGSMHLKYPELVHKQAAHPLKMCLQKVRYSWTTLNSCKKNYTPCHFCNIVVQQGWEGSNDLNYSELVHKYTAHLACPVKVYLEKVR